MVGILENLTVLFRFAKEEYSEIFSTVSLFEYFEGILTRSANV